MYSLSTIIDGGILVLSGYISARLAKHNELLNGALASFLCIIDVLIYMYVKYPSSIFYSTIALFSSPLLGMAGGYLRILQKNRALASTKIK